MDPTDPVRHLLGWRSLLKRSYAPGLAALLFPVFARPSCVAYLAVTSALS